MTIKNLFITILISGIAIEGKTQISPIPVPEKTLWESNMKTVGKAICDKSANTTAQIYDEYSYNSVYYDGWRVYQQIASYLTAEAAY